MSFATNRPIELSDDNNISGNIDENKLNYNLGTVDYLNVQKFDDDDVKIGGVQFYTSPKNKQVLQYNGYNYIFNSLILTPDIDIIGGDSDVSLGLMIDFLTDNMSNHLYIVLPIIKNNSVSTNDSNNELIKTFTDYIVNYGTDIENGTNITINDLGSYELNKLIPSGKFYKYIFQGTNKNHTFIVFPPDSSKIYSNDDKITYGGTTISPKSKTTPGIGEYNPYYTNKIGATQKTIMKDTYEDIYIDCSPVSDASNEIIEQRKKCYFSKKYIIKNKWNYYRKTE